MTLKDVELFKLLDKEKERQNNNIELIASENFVSEEVLRAAGSDLTNKYAEGYPGRRYYGGCEVVDEVEKLAIDRLKLIFGADHANVQPHSGTNANIAVYFAVLSPGDKVLGMNLSEGGHLTHGSPVNISGSYYNFIDYGVDETSEEIDYNEIRNIAIKEKPKLIVAGTSAYSRKIDFAKFREIADEVEAYLLVDMAHIAGLIAAGLHQNPVKYADFVTTTTHKTLRGPRGGAILCKREHAKLIDKSIFPGVQGGPLMHIIAAKAVAFYEAMQPEFITYQKQVLKNANILSESMKRHGFRIVSGGTDTHLFLVDLRNKNLTGKEAEKLLEEVGIASNKNTIPNDPKGPFITSGLRLGTPAITTRGMVEEDMIEIADIINLTLSENNLEESKRRVRELCRKYPLNKRLA